MFELNPVLPVLLPNRLPLPPVVARPKAGLLFPKNPPPVEVLEVPKVVPVFAAFEPKPVPPNALLLAVAVELPKRPPPLVAGVPKAGLFAPKPPVLLLLLLLLEEPKPKGNSGISKVFY